VLLIGVAALVANAAGIAGNIFWETAVQREVPARALSRVTAYDWFASSVAMPAGYGLAAILAAQIGVHDTLWVTFGIGTAVCAVVPALPPVRSLVLDSADIEPASPRLARSFLLAYRVDCARGESVSLPAPGAAGSGDRP
jgi:hypothetical protein